MEEDNDPFECGNTVFVLGGGKRTVRRDLRVNSTELIAARREMRNTEERCLDTAPRGKTSLWVMG